MQSCAVIGCGAAGMVAATTLRRSGLLVTCFELAAEPGGVWGSESRSSFSSRGLVSPVYPTMRCALPKDILSFSDLRFDYTVPQFPHHSSIRWYLEQYAEKKGVRGLVRFNTKVQSLRYDAPKGQTHEPRYPTGIRETLAPFLENRGELHHAFHVKDFRQFKGKRVVVVGDGVTAWDYCLDLHRCGAEVYHSSYSPHSIEQTLNGFDEEIPRAVRGGSAMRDTFSTALQLLSRTPGWRRDVSKGNNIVSNWLHLRNDVLCGKLPSVGSVVSCDGRGILFSGGRVDKLEVLDDMQKLSAVRTGRRDPVQDYDTMHQGAFIDDVDAVICATGYNLRYPFLHDDLRSDLEDPPCLLPQGTQQHNDAPESTTTKPLNHRGLYLGTLYVRNPSIGFVGMQQGLLPPFLLMEAQSKFVSYAFTHRLSLPPDTAGLLSRQDDLVQRYPFLANLYSPHGLGLYSSVYFNVLQEELQVGSRDTYTSAIMERQKWILLTSLLRLVHKVRSMAPLKRKRQHILFSNAV